MSNNDVLVIEELEARFELASVAAEEVDASGGSCEGSECLHL